MDIVEKVRDMLDYDPETGTFTWRNPTPRSRARIGAFAGSQKIDGYMRISLGGKEVLSHRAAWMHFYGEVPPKMIDHINGLKHDNRIANLRLADLAENNWNRSGKEKIAGAYYVKKTKRWGSLIRHRGERLFLGTFLTKEEALQAYQKAAKQLRGEFHDQR